MGLHLLIRSVRLVSVKLTGRRPLYNKIILINLVKRGLKKGRNNQYLFVFCPPYCGSTLLTEILLNSDNVSGNNYLGTKEGQTLPIVKDLMFGPQRFDESADFDWQFIKHEWRKYWDITKPILLEKSPENIFRVKDIKQNFFPLHAVIMVRNPYAQCESFIRRDNLSAGRAAELSVKCLRFQAKNKALLPDAYVTTYEDFVANPHCMLDRMQADIGELATLPLDFQFTSHNHYESGTSIRNVNQNKIDNISKQDLEQMRIVFYENKDILEYWGYSVL